MIEGIILSNLIYNDEFSRNILPYLKDEYFEDYNERHVFSIIRSFVQKYSGVPTKEAIVLAIDTDESINEDRYSELVSVVNSLKVDPDTDQTWLRDETEKFCQDRALYNAVRESIKIMDGKDKEKDRGTIPELLSNALAVSFDANLGHDYLEDWEQQYEYYHREEEKIPFDLEYFNKITNGGVGKKSLNLVIAPTNAGKSLFLLHLAAGYLMSGLNVLYITLEMSEEMTRERIDANVLDIGMNELRTIPKSMYANLIGRTKAKTPGKLIVKEYPTASAHVGHFRHFINELRLKKKFKPDIIIVDYLNICASSRIRPGSNVNSFTLIKSVAEELRGLGVELGLPVWSATQTNRDGMNNSDIDLTNTSESIGITYIVDFMIAMIRSEELDALGQVMIKQLKNRYGDKTDDARFVIGLDRRKMRFHDVEQSAQDDVYGGPIMDRNFGEEPFEGGKKKPSFLDFK